MNEEDKKEGEENNLPNDGMDDDQVHKVPDKKEPKKIIEPKKVNEEKKAKNKFSGRTKKNRTKKKNQKKKEEEKPQGNNFLTSVKSFLFDL